VLGEDFEEGLDCDQNLKTAPISTSH